MSNPETLGDLVRSGHATLGEVRNIAKDIFDGETSGAGPEGYVVTFPVFDDLPDHVQQFVIKAFQFSKVENVLDRKDRLESIQAEVESEDVPEAPVSGWDDETEED